MACLLLWGLSGGGGILPSGNLEPLWAVSICRVLCFLDGICLRLDFRLCMVSILLITPLVAIPVLHFQLTPKELATGLAIFCCVPTTLSSGVSLCQLAGANTALALALTVSTNLLGIFTLPFMLSSLVGRSAGISLPAGPLLKALVETLLIPLLLGKLLRELSGHVVFLDENKSYFSMISSSLLAMVPWMQASCAREMLLQVDTIQLLATIASDFLIALAYFSIPLELVYFVSFSNVFPFRWIIIQFGAFIVLCGLTHFIAIWTYGPQSFLIMLVQTILKIATALVSCATAITLVHVIPTLLHVKVRELFLKHEVAELDREMGLIKDHEEAGRNVRMLTNEIRSSLDRHTILITTLVELAKTLELANCTIWEPNAEGDAVKLTHDNGARVTRVTRVRAIVART